MRTLSEILADIDTLETAWAAAVGADDAQACADCERRHQALCDELARVDGCE
ncbi:hypothetical protein [Methylosinus sp. Sm6]|uniref:hypothetical protein n=1 Tax=Methylosinus sp. Sm6 TaxID=2866948 RepID=UPI001C992412|nr:hypothetical protein [Methylosinus sp. Sm6]MBY6243991.1 hypothetical protein [Methylosinus sp. Sm6]